MIGTKIGDWLVLREIRGLSHALHYECKCKCGTVSIVRSDGLKNGRSQRCSICRHNNLHKNSQMMPGLQIGKWKIIEHAKVDKPQYHYKVQCECGNIKIVNGNALRNGRSNQCRDCSLIIHNMEGTPTYNTWKCMWERCTRIKNHNYHRYGGRGITICERWEKFSNFLADMGIKPTGKQLDRINNDGNYEPSNCKWSTPKENSNNRHQNNQHTIKKNHLDQ